MVCIGKLLLSEGGSFKHARLFDAAMKQTSESLAVQCFKYTTMQLIFDLYTGLSHMHVSTVVAFRVVLINTLNEYITQSSTGYSQLHVIVDANRRRMAFGNHSSCVQSLCHNTTVQMFMHRMTPLTNQGWPWVVPLGVVVAWRHFDEEGPYLGASCSDLRGGEG